MVKAYSFAEKGDSWEGLLQLSGFPDELVHNRQISLEIVTNRLAGFLKYRTMLLFTGTKRPAYTWLLRKEPSGFLSRLRVNYRERWLFPAGDWVRTPAM